MSYHITYSDDAKLDVTEIVIYLADFYASTARNFKTKLDKRVNSLIDMPFSCPVYEEDPFFRRMVLDDYLLFYNVDEKRKLITIHRVFHHSRDIARLLSEYREQI